MRICSSPAADHFFRDVGGTGYPVYATMRMALVNRAGRKSYWPLMTDMDTYFSTRKWLFTIEGVVGV